MVSRFVFIQTFIPPPMVPERSIINWLALTVYECCICLFIASSFIFMCETVTLESYLGCVGGDRNHQMNEKERYREARDYYMQEVDSRIAAARGIITTALLNHDDDDDLYDATPPPSHSRRELPVRVRGGRADVLARNEALIDASVAARVLHNAGGLQTRNKFYLKAN